MPSLKLTIRPWKSPFVLVNTIKMVDFPWRTVSLQEGIRAKFSSYLIPLSTQQDSSNPRTAASGSVAPPSKKKRREIKTDKREDSVRCKGEIHPQRLTWLAGKSPFSIGNTSSIGGIFYCHVSFRGGGGGVPQDKLSKSGLFDFNDFFSGSRWWTKKLLTSIKDMSWNQYCILYASPHRSW